MSLPSSDAPRMSQTLRMELAISILLVTALWLIYAGLWWKSFLGINLEGWFAYYADDLDAGHIPYRDYYCFAPPFHILKTWLINKTVGSAVFVHRSLGILERLAVAILLLWRLSKHLSAKALIIGITTALIWTTGESLDLLYYNHQESICYSVLSAVLADIAISNHSKRSIAHFSSAFLLGTVLGITFLDKQTFGVAVTVFLFIATIIPSIRDRLVNGIATGGTIIIGWLIPVGSCLIWLQANSALASFCDQVFISGPTSKGSLGDVLARPFSLLTNWFVVRERFACFAFFAMCSVLWICRTATGIIVNKTRPQDLKSRSFILTGLILLIPIGIAMSFTWMHIQLSYRPNLHVNNLIVLLLLICVAASSLCFLVNLFRYFRQPIRPTENADSDWLFVLWSGMSLLLLYVAHLSSTIIEPSAALVGAGFPLSLLLSIKFARFAALPRGLVLILCALVLFNVAYNKFEYSYSWLHWQERSTLSRPASSHQLSFPQLAGLNLSPETVEFVEKTVGLIQENSTVTDSIYVYPHMPILYTLSNRRPITFAPVHYFDVCPDWVAAADAERLLANPPAVMVVAMHPDDFVQFHEDLFRNGRPSGQRKITEAIAALSRDYKLVATFENNTAVCPIRVWARVTNRTSP